jgi:prevent-host-death family protein
MKKFTVSKASADLYSLMDEVAATHQPIMITGERGKAVLLSADDWQSIQETLRSAPDMRESIKAGMAEPVEACTSKLDW